jgi:hypothetical protein
MGTILSLLFLPKCENRFSPDVAVIFTVFQHSLSVSSFTPNYYVGPSFVAHARKFRSTLVLGAHSHDTAIRTH